MFYKMYATKMPDMRNYQNKHNMLLNFPRCLSILLLETSKTDNNALESLDIDAIYNLKLRKTQPNSTNSCSSTKLNAKFPWLPILPKQRECILHLLLFKFQVPFFIHQKYINVNSSAIIIFFI
jgi:hypothetical protein